MNVWRIHIKASSKPGIDQRKLCLEKGIVGVGWHITHNKPTISWEEYYDAAEIEYGDSSWLSALNTIKNKIQLNDLIWTRDWIGNYYLGRILGDWYYDLSEECSDADIVNIRQCEWHKIGTEEAVPGKVVSSFRPARTVQRVNDNTVNIYSQILYNQKSSTNFFKLESLKGADIFSLLSTDDCEDALGIYLQVVHDFLIMPSSCKPSTMAYEFELKHRVTKMGAVAQVKSGWTTLNIDDYSDLDTEVYLFATSGKYLGSPKVNVKVINPDSIKEFLYTNTELLPTKMKVWIELTR